MSAETDPPDLKSPIDLAREADFMLGASRVSPSTREVLRGAEREILEPRVMQVLVALFRANGRVVSRDELIARCWEGRIVGEDAINRTIGRLRRLSEVDREASFVVETIPRVGYRLVASSFDIPRPLVSELGAPPPDAQNEKVQFVPAGSRRWLAIAALVLAGAAAVTSAAWLLWPARPSEISVAVLPFDALDSSDAARVFGKAVAEQVVVALNDVQVRTVSREEAAALSGTSRDAAAVKLGAEFILNGSVQSGEKGLHVTVHLDHASTHAAVWTESYDQNGAAALEFQWQIAAVVSEVIRQTLSARKDDPAEMDDAAISIYLKLLPINKVNNNSQENLLEQHMLGRQLIARAPKYAQAYSNLAVISEFLAGSLRDSASADQIAQLRADAKKLASQALALDSKNGIAYQALAGLVPRGAWAEQEAALRKGVAAAPNYAPLSNGLCSVLGGVGRLQEALALCTTSRMLLPTSPTQNAGLAMSLVETGHVAEAISTINRAAKIWPSRPFVWFVRFYILANFGHVDEARAMLDSAQNIPVNLEEKAIAAWRAYLEALRLNTPASKTAAGNVIRSAMATGDLKIADGMQMFAKLGDVDTAFALAGTLYAPHGSSKAREGTYWLFRAVTDSMRRDPRFMPLAAQIGLVDYWTTTGKWPDFCSQPGLSYDCRAAARALTPKAVTPR